MFTLNSQTHIEENSHVHSSLQRLKDVKNSF